MNYDKILSHICFNDDGSKTKYFLKLCNRISQPKTKNIYSNLRKYILNRYNDLEDTTSNILYMIYKGYTSHPHCITCGKPITLNRNGNLKRFCSRKCQNNIEVINKSKNTFLKNHPGYTNSYQFDKTKEKIKQTNLERYNTEYPMQSYEIKNKMKQTNLKRYSEVCPVQNPICYKKYVETLKNNYGDQYTYNFQIPKIRENSIKTSINLYGSPNNHNKYKETCLKKFGYECPLENPEVIKKCELTNYKKYGVKRATQTDNLKEYMSYLMSSEEMQTHRYIIMKENNTFNTSKPEDTCYELLCKKYTDVIRQYRSTEYPYNCDFYIPSKDLYIEYQGSWTHGFHPFDPDNKDDIDKLKLWQSKNTKYYDNAIDTWTKRDVEKRNIATKNKLNYIEIWNLKDEFLK